MKRPGFCTEDNLEYLDNLRLSGEVNMWGAAPHVANRFEMDITEARQVVAYWQETFAERHQVNILKKSIETDELLSQPKTHIRNYWIGKE